MRFCTITGRWQDLGTLHSFDNSSEAEDINNAGDVIGYSGGSGFLYHNGQMTALDSLIDPSLGWTISDAYGINNVGQIIGIGNQGAFLMTPHAAPTPAPSSLLVLLAGGGMLALRLRRKRS